MHLETEQGFPPVVEGRPRVLILGSLPGRRSLVERRYYAQPQNSFWRIMGELFGAGPELPYEQRLECLTQRSVALWDVLAAGQRPGSLDARIVRSTAVFNDFGRFLESHGSLRAICFNGKTAANLYRRHVLPVLKYPASGIELCLLPSTSPAYAAMPFSEKLERWRRVLEGILNENRLNHAHRPLRER